METILPPKPSQLLSGLERPQKIVEELIDGMDLLEAEGYVGSPEPEFGVHGDNNTSIGWDDATFGRHVLYLGGIGTGKTVGITELVKSVRSAMTEDDCMIVFDTKGDYLEEFYKEGDVALSSERLGTYPGQRLWNIFSEFVNDEYHASVEDQIFELCSGLFSNMLADAGKNAYFAVGARDLFYALMVALFREENRNHSNKDIKTVIERLSITEMQEMLDREGNEDLRGARHYIAKDGSVSSMAVIAFMQQVLQESFRSSFSEEGDFSIINFVKEKGGKALFFEYDIAAGSTLAPIFKTMIDLAIKESLGRNRSKGRVFFVLDEFALLPELKHLTDGLNFGRSLGLRFIVGAQNIRQVQAMYGEHIAASVLSAFGSVFSFRLFDGLSRDFVRDRFGRNQKIVRFHMRSQDGSYETLKEGWVVEDWDLSALPPGHCIAAIPMQMPRKFVFKIQPIPEKFYIRFTQKK